MRRVKFNPKNQGTHNGWQNFLRDLKVGDEFEVPGTFGKDNKVMDSRASNVRFMAARVGVLIRTRRTTTVLLARRVA
jgi:hypothetical protein